MMETMDEQTSRADRQKTGDRPTWLDRVLVARCDSQVQHRLDLTLREDHG